MTINKLKTSAVLFGTGIALTFGGIAKAEDPNAILDLLEHKGIITHEEAQQAKTYYEKQEAEAVQKNDKVKLASWVDELKWSGDVRIRYDEIFPESGLNQPDRVRWRFRVRFGADLKLQNWADVGFHLISDDGDPGNPNSGNVTMTSFFSKKAIDIDTAYITIHPPMAEWLKVTGGKFNVPIWHPGANSPMVYDPDLTAEGAGENLGWNFGDKQQYRLMLNAGQYVLNELSGNENDAYMFDQQVVLQSKLDPVKVTVAGGYYFTQNLGNVPYTQSPTSGNTGNSVSNKVSAANFLADFNVLYASGELAWKVSDRETLGTPTLFTFGGEYLKNIKSAYENDPLGNQTDGWMAQVAFGDLAKKGQWKVAYQYKRLEANSTLDLITDDDFGAGGTDRQGHVVTSAYNILDWWQVGFTAFITEKIAQDRTGANSQAGVVGQDRLRIMAQTMVKF